MNDQNPPPASSFAQLPPTKHLVLKSIATLIFATLVAIGAYTVYVLVHEPDPQETVILGQIKIATGCPAALRIVVRNRLTGVPVDGATVELSLQDQTNHPIKLGTFHTDRAGSLADSINIPDVVPGYYDLVIDSRSASGSDHLIQKVKLQHPARLLLVSDKPLYQPGQTIHLRSLSQNDRTQKPFAGQPVTFQVSDPAGNLVFKESRQTSAFGIASADFVLASELNPGRYEIVAAADDVTATRTVEVKNYVLPKFKIQLTTGKSFYLPGETVYGSVQADYFFGRPVNVADVKLTVSTFQGKPVVVTELAGQTDATGKYSFHFTTPDLFAGQPQNDDRAFLDLTAEVCDAGKHVEEKNLSLSVAQGELAVTAISEAGTFVPGVENILYVLTSYPDGNPAACTIFLDGKSYPGDVSGVCEIRLTPTTTGQTFDLQAIDADGKKVKLAFHPDAKDGPPALVLRTDRAVYHAGETVRFNVLSPETNDTVFVDVIQDGQAVLTTSIPLAQLKGAGDLKLPATLTGLLRLHAYVLTGQGGDLGGTHLIYVNPASGLRIDTTPSKTVYRPGEIARLDFAVTDADGRPAPSALSVAIVDESVFALAENHPGILQPLSNVEGDLLQPRYPVRAFDSPAQLLAGGNQVLAAAYLASLEIKPAGRSLDDLVKGGYLPQSVIDHARQMRGTPEYESLRQNPDFAEMVRLLDGEGADDNFRVATGPAKLSAANAHRQACLQNLQQLSGAAFLGLLFLSPILLLIFQNRPAVDLKLCTQASPGMLRYLSLAGTMHNALTALILLPMVCYPLGLIAMNEWWHCGPDAGWFLFGIEVVVVTLTAAVLFHRLADPANDTFKPGALRLRDFLILFLIQFVISRAGFISIIWFEPYDPTFPAFWFGGSLVTPLVVVGALSSHVRRQLTAKGIEARFARTTILEVLVVIAIVVILAAMLLPALACAKKKAQRVSLSNDFKEMELANNIADGDGNQPAAATASAPHIRRDFPETLFWRPELITDDQGKASLEIPLADSITTWQGSVDGVSAAGKLGAGEFPINVFQDFFVDLDLPVSLSLDDQVSIPVTCYNYLKAPQDIHLTLAGADWFASSVQDVDVHLAANEVKSVHFPVKVLRVGDHVLRVTARGTQTSDAVEREIRVVPTGTRLEHTRNDVLKDALTHNFTVPTGAVPASDSLWLKCYPSRYSEILEGVDSIFEEPYGCFEQTSSTTYPNVLALDYLQRMGRLTPKTAARAQAFINTGYQRLLSFEVPGGGFEWFGRAPAHVGLTAYGIMEFTDMNRVHPVDSAMVERTRQWLYSRQNSDGSWDPAPGLDEWSGNSPVTAYVAWALAESSDTSPALERALEYLRSHPEKISNNYQKSLAANAFLARDRNDAFGRELLNQLKGDAITGDKLTHWPSQGLSLTYEHGSEIEVETTALCTMAMIKAGLWPETIKESLGWLSRQKSHNGTWGTTQATILAMRALIQGSTASLGQGSATTITVSMNGGTVETFQINRENSDVMKQVNLTKYLRSGENRVELNQTPGGELPVQLSGVYWLPGQSNDITQVVRPAEKLLIAVRYDRTTLAVNDSLHAAVAVENSSGRKINMAMIDLGIPPGFEVDPAIFENLQQDGKIEKFEATETHVVLYLRELPASAPFKFTCSLRAKYPLQVQTPASTVYEYYQPQNRAQTMPVMLQVEK